ncbi:MAG: polX, partial [Solirubrobacterales bacterium]|nr:polX [Solirubrobacterales bacterium]
MITNAEIAAALDELGDLYELDGAVVHRIVAYRSGAKAVREASRSVGQMAIEGRATDLPGIGKTLQDKIATLARGEPLAALERMRAQFPPGLLEMTRLPGLGPKRARRLFDELGLDSLDALREAAEQERIRDLRGFGEKAETAILAALAETPDVDLRPRFVLDRALAIGDAIVEALRERGGPEAKVELAGSARRWADSVKDLDVIAAGPDAGALVGALTGLELVESVFHSGEAGAKVRTHSGMTIDLKVVAPDQFGNLLQHFTGSKAHNMALRDQAVRRGLHVSEYGILDDSTGETYRCATEEEVYERLGMAWIPPELREGRGELEAAARGELPELVRVEDIRGDLHCHTVASDGKNTIEEMAAAARERGYEYLCITDHSASHGFGDDVQPDELRAQIARVREIDAGLEGFDLLIGSEVNILPDGSLDYEDDVLAELDWVVASVHTSFGLGEDAMTDRVIAALEHPYVDCLGHPTGRKIAHRPPYAIDLERVIDAAARTGTMIEINGNPDRRDLDDVHARAAAEAGVPIVVQSDAHRTSTLAVVRYGIATARRAWLTPARVANTRPWSELAPMRKRAQGSIRGRSARATTSSTAAR